MKEQGIKKHFLLNRLNVLALSGIFVLLGLTWGCVQEGPTVQTEYGPVKGFVDTADTWVWKAVPFAKPPGRSASLEGTKRP